jgi:probable HAF family extracellular repeat protein
MITKIVNPRIKQAITTSIMMMFVANSAHAVNYTVGSPIVVDSYQTSGINNAGQFIGSTEDYSSFSVYNANGTPGPVAHTPSGLPAPPWGLFSTGQTSGRFNDLGQVVGYAWNAAPGVDYGIPLRWDGATGAVTRLANLGFDFGSGPKSINNQGQAVGTAWGGADFRPVSWDASGAITDLGTLGGSRGLANDINNAGTIVGNSYTAGDDADHATVWHNGNIIDLGTLGGTTSTAHFINNAGQIVGTSGLSLVDDTPHLVLWNQNGNGITSFQDLGAMPLLNGQNFTTLTGFNDAGTIVASAVDVSLCGGNGYCGVLWDSNGITNLNTYLSPEQIAAGWSIFSANGINNDGVILASVMIPGQTSTSPWTVLLTPTAVPVPGAVWLFGSALISYISSAQRKKMAA